MSDRTLLALLREDQLTLYTMNGDGSAVELAKLRVSDQTPNGIASLVQGLAPFLAKQAPAPKPSGIMATKMAPARQPVKRAAKRAYKQTPGTQRMPIETRASQLRAMVARQPGISRTDVLAAMGLTNPSGTQWMNMVARAGVRVAKEGAGRTARTSYWPADAETVEQAQ